MTTDSQQTMSILTGSSKVVSEPSANCFYYIMEGLCKTYPYFTQKKACTGCFGFSSNQKIASVLRLLAYGTATDSINDYLLISESMAGECLKRFNNAVAQRLGAG